MPINSLHSYPIKYLRILFPHHNSTSQTPHQTKNLRTLNFLLFNMYKHPIDAFFILLTYFTNCMFVLIIYLLSRIVHQSFSQT